MQKRQNDRGKSKATLQGKCKLLPYAIGKCKLLPYAIGKCRLLPYAIGKCRLLPYAVGKCRLLPYATGLEIIFMIDIKTSSEAISVYDSATSIPAPFPFK
jgi:hypothetical protein